MQTVLEISANFQITIGYVMTLYLCILSIASQTPILVTSQAVYLGIHYLSLSCQ